MVCDEIEEIEKAGNCAKNQTGGNMFGGVSNFWSSLDIRWFIIKQRARDLDISTCDASGGEWGVRSKVEEDLTLIPNLNILGGVSTIIASTHALLLVATYDSIHHNYHLCMHPSSEWLRG